MHERLDSSPRGLGCRTAWTSWLAWALLLLLAGLGPVLAGGAEQGAPPELMADPETGLRNMDDAALQKLLQLHMTEHEEVRMVLLQAVVCNRHGRPIRDLEAGDFILMEDQSPQTIRYFDTEVTRPIAIAFVLDLSGSMRQAGKLDEAKQSIEAFVRRMRPQDRMALIGFADDQVTWITDFTSDHDQFLRRLAVQEAYGQTALYDAVAATPRMVDSQVGGSKAIVLITDGIDNASRMNTFQARQLARSVSVPIYVVSLRPRANRLLAETGEDGPIPILAHFAHETGGRIFPVHEPDDLVAAVLAVQDELRFQYLIGYYPARQDWDGAFRRIQLHTNRGGAYVRTRRGYYAVP